MVKSYFYFFLLFCTFTKVTSARAEQLEDEKNKVDNIYPTMAPNSKFLNPHVDDATNLQFAIAAFGNGIKETEKKTGETEDLLELLDNFDSSTSNEELQETRSPKALRDLKIFPMLQSVITNGNKKYISKKI